MFAIHHRWMVWTALIVSVVLLVFFMKTTKTGLVPQEDQRTVMVNISTSPGSTLTETVKVLEKVKEYHGLYHVLGGAISPMGGIGPDQLRIQELLDRITASKKDKHGMEEIYSHRLGVWAQFSHTTITGKLTKITVKRLKHKRLALLCPLQPSLLTK